MEGELERIDAFVRWTEDRTSSRIEPWRFGSVLLHDGFPHRYDSNFLRVERSLGDATARDLAAEAERLLSAFGHREIVIPVEAEGARVAPGFAELGWAVDRIVYLCQHHAPDREAPDVEVDERTVDQVRPLLVAVNAAHGMDRATAEELAGFRDVLVDRIGARLFVARVDGTDAACCDLYVHDGVAQVEDVNTLEAFRGRGLARAVVLRAVAEARDAGADLVFLMADDEDWPKHLYGKLGFERVGSFWQFTRVLDRAASEDRA